MNGTSSKNIELAFKSYNCRKDDFFKLKLNLFKTFKYNAPRLGNSLPLQIKTLKNIFNNLLGNKFKTMFKTMLIQDTFGVLSYK